jgi:hypothetical protein
VRSRIAASVVLAAGVLLGSTGCAFFSPVATQLPYEPSDGVSTTVGDIKVRNAMAITDDGTDVNLVMVVVNSGTKAATVNFEYGFSEGGSGIKQTDHVNIAPGETLSYGNGEDAPTKILDGANVELGGLMPIFVQYGDETGKEMLVPVLDGSLPGYEDLVVTPTPTPTSTPTADTTSTPTPTPTAAP